MGHWQSTNIPINIEVFKPWNAMMKRIFAEFTGATENMPLAPAAVGTSGTIATAQTCNRKFASGTSGTRIAGARPYGAALAGIALLALLAACGEENRFVPPPPPKVTVQLPIQQTVTPYLEATGNAAAVNTTKLVARVQGYVQEIKYQDGDTVKKGTPLFVIEPEPYKVKLDQAQAAEDATKAALVYAEAEFKRYSELRAKDVSSEANLDKARANRDTGSANVEAAHANTRAAEINYGYTTVSAPFDGVVTARRVSIGELVGGDQTNELASIVQTDPIWVWFNLSERDIQRARASLAARGLTRDDLINKAAVEAGLQTETGYPLQGLLDYADPTVNQSTGTMQLRAIFNNANHLLLPGYFVRVRVPLWPQPALLVPEAAVGSDQGGRYVLALNADNIVEQRRVELGQSVGDLRVVVSGLKPDERVVVAGVLDAVPGQKVDPQLRTAAAADAAGSK